MQIEMLIKIDERERDGQIKTFKKQFKDQYNINTYHLFGDF